MSERLSREFLDKWGPLVEPLEFQGKRIKALGENDLRALLAYQAHRDAALSAAVKQGNEWTDVLNRKGCRGAVARWLLSYKKPEEGVHGVQA
ncbi:MAG TPA: hypothetical protein VFP95_07175 [Gammaproteobacteria bacterium]|nr:hypothetical protein [Gammaproteobacteria bacterium]